MKTKAHFKGHPIHPMLVAFPVAFLFGAVLADILGLAMNRPRLWGIGECLSAAGIIAGLIAAVPGLIDYLLAVPPRSSAKKRATWHMIVNVSSMALFVLAFMLRGPVEAATSIWIIPIEVVAIGLMTCGGWMGGTLVYRNFIGPEHRYANKGKWQEQSYKAKSGETIVVAVANDLEKDQMKLARVNGKRIVIAKDDNGWVAFDDHCAHRGASLADGVLICGKVQCLWHGSRYDVRTGRVESGPADSGIAVYLVEESNGEVRLRVP